MENAKQNEGGVPRELTADQATSISGGTTEACPATVTVGPISDSGATLGAVLNDIYQGFVDVTSNVIEQVAKATKPS